MWGPVCVGAPVRPYMLNMPKSASVLGFVTCKRFKNTAVTQNRAIKRTTASLHRGGIKNRVRKYMRQVASVTDCSEDKII